MRRQVANRLAVLAFTAALSCVSASVSLADAVCGPGKHLATNAWACLPGDRGTSSVKVLSNSGSTSQVAAGVAAGGLILSLVNALAGGTRMTDDAGPAPSTHESKLLTREQMKGWHGTQSWQFNRKGIALQRAGDYDGARKAFNKAADEASEAGNYDDASANDKNAHIADALHWLRAGYLAERDGKIQRANISYKQGIKAAELAGRPDLAQKIKSSNSALLKSGGNQKSLIGNNDDCDMINGEYSCRVR